MSIFGGKVIEGAVGRCPTLLVAAANASIRAKAAAWRVCDGTADEEEIQAALDALTHSGNIQGGTVILSEGIPATAASILLKAYGNRLVGQGPEATSIELASGGPVIKMGDGSSSDNGKQLHLARLMLSGNTGQIVVEIDKVQRNTIKEVVIRGWGTGLKATDFQWTTLEDMQIRNCKTRGIWLVAGMNSDGHFLAKRVSISLNSSAADAAAACMEISGAYGIYDALFQACDFITSGNASTADIKCVYVSATGGNIRLVFDGCSFECLDDVKNDVIGFLSDAASAYASIVFRSCSWFGGGLMATGLKPTNAAAKYRLYNCHMNNFKTGGIGIDNTVGADVVVDDFTTVDVTTPTVGTVKTFDST